MTANQTPTPVRAYGPSVSQLRHRAEMPMLVLGIVLTVIVSLGALTYLLLGLSLDEWALGVLIGLFAPIISFIYIRYLFWSQISNGVEVTDEQFPELYRVYHDLAVEMGFGAGTGRMSTIPQIYVINGNGMMNAYASKCQLQRGYVVVYSDIVDLAYMYGDFGALRFIMAHELGHIKCGHVNLWRNGIQPILVLLRLSPLLSRAQEYTADRTASFYAPQDAMKLIALFAGKNMAKHVDVDAYIRSVDRHKNGFWLRLSNFLAGHAVGFRRMKALSLVKTHGWNVQGKML
ncbi:M48 family metallopeptidase [Brevibacterium sp. XM4083]|uniref:M48 family metallopeptidase n=1 Tax=Brevibacterium sp. XM4083 TaxID=2583238 RepID=UPI001C63FEE2|nr:M48 family metallopeptidase [Brevibacterium sp. XM4083]MCM1013659.1 M48 family metallopeptidase [Brevibacterium sp. XM4083]